LFPYGKLYYHRKRRLAIKLIEPLNSIFDQFSKLKVLRLLTRTDAELSGREIAKAVGISHVICNRSLQELSRHGLIRMRKAGRSILYSLNKDHILVKDFLTPLFLKENRLFSLLKKLLLEKLSEPKPLSIVLFGSQIKKERARPDSDFDIMFILPNDIDLKKFKREIAQSEAKIERIFGNRAALLIMKKNEFLKRRDKGDSLLLSVEKENKLIFGKHLREIK